MIDRLPDQQERDTALDPGRSFIVEAPAGSGKTGLLIQRYLGLLSRVAQPESVLAITFTRKAVAEMRGRVIASLAAARAGKSPDSAHERKTLELAAAALERSNARGFAIEQNPNRLNIRTIDAFCAALTRQLPITARLGAPPEIVEDARPLYRAAARITLQELENNGPWSEPIARLLAHLDNHLPRVENLLAEMLAKRDQWLGCVSDVPERTALERALGRCVEERLAPLAALWPDDTEPDVVALCRYAVEHLPDPRGSPIAALAGMGRLPRAQAADLPVWRGLAELLLTDKGAWRARLTAKQGFPAPGGKLPAGERARAEEMKARCQSLIDRLGGIEELNLHLHAARNLPDPAYDDAQWALMVGLFELLKLAAARLELAAAERGEIDFLGVSLAAVHALGGADAPSDLALALDYRLQHILVDEFQDTSLAQYQLLAQLTAGWMPGDGHTLFLVGDPMQSIYRFREAQVGLFLKTWETRRLGHVTLTPLRLSANLRSHQGIVDWVNAVFARVLPPRPELGLGGVPHAPAHAVHPAEAEAVHLHASAGFDAVTEAQQVVALVQAALRETDDETVGILVRNREHLNAIAAALKTAGLVFRAVEIEGLGERPAVLDLLALTRALLHPADRVAWLAILRAPWCGLTLSDLLALAGNDRDVTIWERLNDMRRLRALSDDGRARIARMVEVLRDAFAERRRRPLRRHVEGVWLALGGPATLTQERDLDNAASYFDLLEELDEGGDLPDLALLEDRVAGLYAVPGPSVAERTGPASETRIQVMTMHKAKGLEFDTVILPGLGRGKRREDPRLLMWLRYHRLDSDDLLFAPIKAAGERQDPLYQWLACLEAQAGEYEDGRLLYVAATRARRRLHLFGHLPVREVGGERRLTARPQPGSLLERLWPAMADEFAGLSIESAPTSGRRRTGKPPAVIRRLPPGWQMPPLPERVRIRVQAKAGAPAEAIEFSWAGRTARLVGIVVHRFLQKIAHEGVERWPRQRVEASGDAIRRTLAAFGTPAKVLDEAAARVVQAVSSTLDDQRGRWILDRSHPQAASEYHLTGVLDGEVVNVVIDRTFVDHDGTRWIIDFKTSVHEGGGVEEFLDRERERYRGQLERYAVLMSGGERPVRLGLYFPLLCGWREWPAPQDT